MCFKMSVPSVTIPKVETTARDILPATESASPDSPIMGSDDNRNESSTGTKKGKSALTIAADSGVNNATLTKSRGPTGYNVF